jgi:hypothetical protein
MTICTAFYKVFYKKLCEHVLNKILDGNTEDRGKTLMSRFFWDGVTLDLFRETFIGTSTSVRSRYYYYRQSIILNPAKVRDGGIDPDLLRNGLLYIASTEQRAALNGMTGGMRRLNYLIQEFETTNKEAIEEIKADHSNTWPEFSNYVIRPT